MNDPFTCDKAHACASDRANASTIAHAYAKNRDDAPARSHTVSRYFATACEMGGTTGVLDQEEREIEGEREREPKLFILSFMYLQNPFTARLGACLAEPN